jgi:hypothetical protein
VRKSRSNSTSFSDQLQSRSPFIEWIIRGIRGFVNILPLDRILPTAYRSGMKPEDTRPCRSPVAVLRINERDEDGDEAVYFFPPLPDEDAKERIAMLEAHLAWATVYLGNRHVFHPDRRQQRLDTYELVERTPDIPNFLRAIK